MSGLSLLWMESPDDNDTSAVKNYGGRALARGMLRRGRVPQGVRRLQSRFHILRSTPGEGK